MNAHQGADPHVHNLLCTAPVEHDGPCWRNRGNNERVDLDRFELPEVTAVKYAFRDTQVAVASAYKGLYSIWMESRKIRQRMEYKGPTSRFSTAKYLGAKHLRELVAGGYLCEKVGYLNQFTGKRGPSLFTLPSLKAAQDIEDALTPEERAERTMVRVRKMYLENQKRYGDQASLWSVSMNLAAVPQDGIKHAIDMGLAVEARSLGFDTRGSLVPSEYVDAYREANEAEERHKESLDGKARDLQDSIISLLGSDGVRRGNRRIELNIEAMQRLVNSLEESTHG